MGGKADGQDTRREEYTAEGMHRDAKTGEVTDKPEIGKTYYPNMPKKKSSVALRKEKEAADKKKVEEGIDFKGARREDDRREKAQAEKDKKNPSGKARRLAMGKFRPGASKEERAEGGRDSMREKGTSPKKDGKKMFEHYLELRASKKKVAEDFLPEADLADAGRENQGEREKKKLTGKGVDNTSNIKLMPVVGESVVTEHSSKVVSSLSSSSQVNETLRARIQEMGRLDEECCPKCGTPECVCEDKKEEKPKKKKAKLDEAGMPILEYSRNNATGPTKEMIDPGKDPEGEPGVMNPKGKPKRYKNKGEAPGDRRPNDPSGPELPFDKGTVPNGSGV